MGAEDGVVDGTDNNPAVLPYNPSGEFSVENRLNDPAPGKVTRLAWGSIVRCGGRSDRGRRPTAGNIRPGSTG